MKKKSLNCLFVSLLLVISSFKGVSQAIIADHTVVDKYKDIPLEYINKVKKMWVIYAGESHSYAIRKGVLLLEEADPIFQVSVVESGTPEPYTDQNLRLSRATWGSVMASSIWIYDYGEEDWFTSSLAIERTKEHLKYCNTNNLDIAAMGFGWCWDMTADNGPTNTKDPVYNVGWAGRSNNGPQGSKAWGLDADDYAITGNTVCMDTYINATTEYINYCKTMAYPTKVFFTTGPVDTDENKGEKGYQRQLKHEYIRSYVNSSSERILFDYADILCWNESGNQNLVNWTDGSNQTHTFQFIHPDNMKTFSGTYSEAVGHIGEVGALRLAKAMWWMLARIAGWDGVVTKVNDLEEDTHRDLQLTLIGDEICIETTDSYVSGQAYLFNISGALIQKKKISDYRFSFNINSCNAGIYFVKLTQANKTVTGKIVVVK